MTELLPGSINRDSPVPFYFQLAEMLEEEIVEGRWQSGQRLPSEPDLCEYYGLSRTTIRQALSRLEQEGLVARLKGRGTFVQAAQPRSWLIQTTEGFFHDEFVRTGHRVTSKVLRLERRRCPAGRRALAPAVREHRGDARASALRRRPRRALRDQLPARVARGRGPRHGRSARVALPPAGGARRREARRPPLGRGGDRGAEVASCSRSSRARRSPTSSRRPGTRTGARSTATGPGCARIGCGSTSRSLGDRGRRPAPRPDDERASTRKERRCTASPGSFSSTGATSRRRSSAAAGGAADRAARRRRPPLRPARRGRAGAPGLRRRARPELGHDPRRPVRARGRRPRRYVRGALHGPPPSHETDFSLARGDRRHADGRISFSMDGEAARHPLQPGRLLRPPSLARVRRPAYRGNDARGAGRAGRCRSRRAAALRDGVYVPLFPAVSRLEVDYEGGTDRGRSSSRATCSRWRTSATGRTRRSRPTARRSRSASRTS